MLQWSAIKSFSGKYVDSFIKELTDLEAIKIQGSENLQRKNYDPIEETTLYKHYREYWLKEKSELLTHKEIADAFNSTKSNVQMKLGLLDLPVNVQQKIINKDIPVGKALALVRLTTEDQPSPRMGKGLFEVGPRKERTDRYFFEIEERLEDIEKFTRHWHW